MIDHTLTFASEAAAIAALPEFRDGAEIAPSVVFA